MADKTRRSLFWKVASYYGVLIALLLVLVGVIQPEWLKYLPLGGLEGLSNSTALTAEDVFLGQASTVNQPGVFLENAVNLLSAMIGSLSEEDLAAWIRKNIQESPENLA